MKNEAASASSANPSNTAVARASTAGSRHTSRQATCTTHTVLRRRLSGNGRSSQRQTGIGDKVFQSGATGQKVIDQQDFLPAQVARPLAGSGHLRGVFALEQGKVSNLRLGFSLRDVVLQLPAMPGPPCRPDPS
mgnify:CR=1 FL=1